MMGLGLLEAEADDDLVSDSFGVANWSRGQRS